MSLLLLFTFGVPIWDKLVPLRGYDDVIRERYGSQCGWCIAFSYSWHSTFTNRERIYLLFPQAFSDASLVSVSSTNNDRPSASEIDYGALFTAFGYGSIVFALVKLRQPKGRGRSHNEQAE